MNLPVGRGPGEVPMHLMRRSGLVSLAAAVLVLWGCDRAPPAAAPQAPTVLSPAATQTAVAQPLPVLTVGNVPVGPGSSCAGVGLDATLHGETGDGRIAWLVTAEGGRLDVVWPAGYHARFAPRLEVLDESGRVVLREGDRVGGGCVTGDPDILWLSPPFR